MFVWILITSQVNEIKVVSVTLHCWYLKAGQYNLISYSSSLLQAATAYPPIHNQCQYALYRKLLLANILWILSCIFSSPKGIFWYWKKTPDRCVRWSQWANASCKARVYVYISIAYETLMLAGGFLFKSWMTKYNRRCVGVWGCQI